MKILLFSTLYPNAAQPHHGIFVENRLRHLLDTTGWEARVVAPVPWFPAAASRLGPGYAAFAQVPAAERRHGIEVLHPRYPVIPKVGMTVAPGLLCAAARGSVKRLLRDGYDFDLIDAHYFYPDGVAAAMLAAELGKPFVVTGRGTDLNLIPRYRLPRAQIAWAAERAEGLITVCDALADDLAALGVDRARVSVLRNGVDLTTFTPDPRGRERLRGELEVSGPVVLSVGHLIERKGHDLAIRAIAGMPEASLLIVGSGPEEAALKRLTHELGMEERVRFVGSVPHETLKNYYSAADILILGSSREGWPNVLLESMACGTPVVATAVNGSPEVVRDPVAGQVVSERSPEALARGLAAVLADLPERAAVRRYAEDFSWDATSRGQQALFTRILANGGAPAASAPSRAY